MDNNFNQNGMSSNAGGSGCGIASMVLGIVALCLGCCFWYISLPLAIVGVILGFVGIKRPGKGMAIAGIVCSIIALAPITLGIILGGAYFATMLGM